MDNYRFVLASGSPRRIEIMRKNGIMPVVIRPEAEETLPEPIGMKQAVMYLALKKALSVEPKVKEEIVIAADTVVYKDRIIGKPKDKEDAFLILSELRGQTHYVATGVAILIPGSSKRRIFCEITEVHFKKYNDKTIHDYIAGGEVWDKAGAYAIQGGFQKEVEYIVGDLDNVIGFPWKRIVKELKFLGVRVEV